MPPRRPARAVPAAAALIAGVMAAPASCTAVGAGSDPLPGVVLDLVRRPERAELRWGEALVVDGGSPAAEMYALGGWRTGMTRDPAGGGLVAAGRSGALVLPVDFDGPARLTVRCRSSSGSKVGVFLDGEHVCSGRPPAPDVPFTLTGVVDPGPGRGEHSLVVRSEGGSRLSWLTLGPAGVASSGAEPPARPAGPDLVVEPGWRVGYAMQIPAGAALRGVACGGGAHLEVSGVLASGGTVRLGTTRVSRRCTPFAADLAPLAGQVVRLELSSRGSAVRIERAQVSVDESARPPPDAHPRNVLVVLVDTHRADRLSVIDPSARPRTPGTTHLARDGAVFVQAHTHANWTKPSVASLMTSLMPWQHGAVGRDDVLDEAHEILPERLERHGWQTAGFVTNGFISETYGFKRGWDHWTHSRFTGRSRAEQVVDDVVRWLDTRDDDRPFFIYVHTTDPHSPYVPPAEILARYDPDPYDSIADFTLDPLLIHSIRQGACELDDRDRVRFVALYDGEVDYHDGQVAELLSALEMRGLHRDTLVVLVSDHGEELFDHGSVGHGRTWYEEVMRVPLVIRWPGVTGGGTRIEEPVGLVDVAPTILAALGLDVPAQMAGRSLAGAMLGRRGEISPVVPGGHKPSWRTAVAGRYKLVAHATSRHGLAYHLYDLEADPHERCDIASQNPLIVGWLRGLLGIASAETRPPEGGSAAAAAVVDPATAEHLRALGYLEE
jgi:arylsulfatase A-like enzyme